MLDEPEILFNDIWGINERRRNGRCAKRLGTTKTINLK